MTENVGKILTTEELAYVARDAKQYARRVRELRTEHVYSIATRFTGRPDLNVGQYVLQSKERVAGPHDRRIPESLQKTVYERDNNTCRICGCNEERNLIVLCSRCHDEVHAGRHEDVLRRIEDLL